jgi:predicted phosphodiesterase
MQYTTEPVIEKTSANVLTVRFDNVSTGWGRKILLTSDRHHDSVHCDRKLEKKHLDQALEDNALIIDVGDLFDAMQGKFDPRRSYDNLRPEYKSNTYLDDIVTDGGLFYAPYAKNWLVVGRGNHDQTVLKNCGTDLISNLVYRMNAEGGGDAQAGGYGGWIRFLFVVNKTRRMSVKLKYYHGSGGGGPVTRGVIQTNRQAVYLPDADIVVNGHTHDAWTVPIARERLSDKGFVGKDVCWYVRTPTYQEDYGDGSGGWHVERGGPPKPKGCGWIQLFYENERMKIQPWVDVNE